MDIFERLFGVILNEYRISDDNLESYTLDFIARLQANNSSHDWDTMITATQAALTQFQNSKGSKKDTKMLRTSKTNIVVSIEKQYVDLVRQAQATVLTKYKKSDAIYDEFFTKNITYYTRPKRSLINENISHFITCFTAHTSDFGSTMTTAFTNLLVLFNPARTQQENQIGLVKSKIVETFDERTALCIQLQSNIYTLSLKYMGKLKFIDVYMDRSKLYSHEHIVVEPGKVHIIKIKALKTKNSGIKGLEGMTLRVISIKGRVVLWSATSVNKPTMPPQAVSLFQGGDSTVKMPAIGKSPNAKYLMIKNLDSFEAEVTVEIVTQYITPPAPPAPPTPTSTT